MLPVDAAGWRRAAAALLRRLVALLLALLASLTAASSPAPPQQPPPPAAAQEAEPREAAFAASAASAGYGYKGRLAALRAAEFARLRGTAYLDHAGAALYSEAQVADVARALAGALLGNPRAWPLSAHAARAAATQQRPPARVPQPTAPPAAVARRASRAAWRWR